ncbi:MAG: hypothetical protein H6642_03315 [Caldilineaceae bacterium]|nr:hypothetical protein [Caldilineaceae bacterium]
MTVKPHNQFLLKVLHHAGSLLSVGALLFSWFACYLWIMAMTEGWGAPWDTAPIRPPIGYWQRTVNDFFESGMGAYLPAALFLTISVFLYARALAHTRTVRTTSLMFTLTNLAALVGLTAIGLTVGAFLTRVPVHLTPEDWSYWGDFRREWPLFPIALLLFAGLFLGQSHLAQRLFPEKR